MLNRLAAAAALRLKPGPHCRIVFFHLPRTGGTSLAKDVLFPNFPESRWCHVNFGPDMRPIGGAHDPLSWPAWRRRRVRLLAGHMPIGFADHFAGASEYITLMRDPISRTVSDYYFCRKHPSNPAHEAAVNLSLSQFVEKGYGFSHNCYARWLSNAAFGAGFRGPDAMLEKAMENLSKFSFVGITENFEISVERLCRRYCLVPHAAGRANRNDATPQRQELSSGEREIIRHFNALDLVIFRAALRLDTARGRFEHKKASMGL
ncbi:MAG TPA: hypothetical protein VJN43_09140 [Bryobacteraceae bacterium]|nr:hypothetical protein [Bryobacteraceae bacterium]